MCDACASARAEPAPTMWPTAIALEKTIDHPAIHRFERDAAVCEPDQEVAGGVAVLGELPPH